MNRGMPATDDQVLVALARRVSVDAGIEYDRALAAVQDIDQHGADSPHIALVAPTARAMFPRWAHLITEVGEAFRQMAQQTLLPAIAQMTLAMEAHQRACGPRGCPACHSAGWPDKAPPFAAEYHRRRRTRNRRR